MFALYEDAGRIHAGRVMSESDSALQIELASGKRVKAKAASVLLRFAEPDPDALLTDAAALAAETDLDLAWQFAPEGEFGFGELAADYYGGKPGSRQQAAALLALFGAPHYFRRLGKGRFRKAPEETVKAALLGIEKKRRLAEQVSAWADELAAGTCPPPVRDEIYRILFRPDKNAPAYKAVVEAARRTGRPPLDLLKAAGAIDSPYQFHWRRFVFEHFPKGVAFPAVALPVPAADLPLSPAAAFSIDDSQTTEIDDALSLQGRGSGRVTVGIHIAAPALAVSPEGDVDRIARERLSTVYIPGHKLTMLPSAVVDAFTLREGRECPVISLYVTVDEASLEILESQTRIERIAIAANLRHDVLEQEIDEAAVAAGAPLPASLPFAAELGFLYGFAKALKARRERVRGKPEAFNRPDYAFRIGGAEGKDDGAAIAGDEPVEIVPRRRGSPLDLIVAEAMILANATWGGWLAECGVPAIYRSQASLAPGVKVRMGTRPAPHAGIGVAQYAWSTSPLRRYVDLVNQWQIVACARHGKTAALAAPFKPNDVRLMSIVADFDAAYTEYARFQSAIERYWSLQWLRQHGIDGGELDATTMKDGLVRADSLPLVFRAAGAEGLPRSSAVRVRVAGIDLLTLDLHATVAARRDLAAPADVGATADAEDEAGDSEEIAASAPLTIGVDVADGSGRGDDGDAASSPAVAAEPAG